MFQIGSAIAPVTFLGIVCELCLIFLQSRHPVVVVSLLDELLQRDCLHAALSNRDEVSLEPLLHFLIKQITNPHYTMLLHRVANAVLGMFFGAPVVLIGLVALAVVNLVSSLVISNRYMRLIVLLFSTRYLLSHRGAIGLDPPAAN